jgi:hypothetical protein
MTSSWVNRTKPAYMDDIDTLRFPIPLPADILEPVVKVKGGNRMSHFSYNSVQTHSTYVDGHRTEVTEATKIKNGKGMKTVTKRNGRKVTKKTLPLKPFEIKNIQTRKFMPSLFADCHNGCDSQKTRKVKRRTKKHSK